MGCYSRWLSWIVLVYNSVVCFCLAFIVIFVYWWSVNVIYLISYLFGWDRCVGLIGVVWLFRPWFGDWLF